MNYIQRYDKNMAEKIDLEELEKKAWKTTFEDGIFDIYFGILYLGLTVGMIADVIFPEPFSSLIGYMMIFGGLIFFLIGKKYISEPRIGKVKFGSKRIARKAKTIGVLTINFIILLIIFLIGSTNPELKVLIPEYFYGLIIGLLFFALPLCFVAYFLQFNRLYVIAFLVGLSFFLEEIFALFMEEPFDALFSFGIISAIILCMGLVVFIRFLKKYTLPKE